MKMTLRVTTFAVKFEDRWTISTYARMNAKNDKTFANDFMTDYDGNGIVDVKILESEDFEYEINTFEDMENITKNLDEVKEGINHTILNY